MTIQELLTNLEESAKKATPGPWCFNSYSEIAPITRYWQSANQEEVEVPWIAKVPRKAGDTATEEGKNNAEFISACNPANILALLSYVKELENKIENLRAADQYISEFECGFGLHKNCDPGVNFHSPECGIAKDIRGAINALSNREREIG